MHVNCLPDDILVLVLRAALPAIKTRAADVKDGLELLSVCRRWREVALPVVYDTVFISGGTQSSSPDNAVACLDIKTMADLVAGARCLHVVRRMVIHVFYQDDAFPELKAVIAKLCGVADEWKGVRQLELNVIPAGWNPNRRRPLVADHEDDIDSVSSAFAALMPGLRGIKIADAMQTQVTSELFGRLIGYYVDQLEVLHSSHALAAPQDRVFGKLKDVKIDAIRSAALYFQPPRLCPEVIESLSLRRLTANEMWSMFCAGLDEHAITFSRLANLCLEYCPGYMMMREPLSVERPWALQFSAAKRVRVICEEDKCPSMENALFPPCVELLNIQSGLGILRAMANAKVQVSQGLVLHARNSPEHNVYLETISGIFEAAGPCRLTKLYLVNRGAVSLERFTYTGLTHLRLHGPASVDDVMGYICTQPRLVSLHVDHPTPTDPQMDFSIPACVEHDPVAPLDTQLREFTINILKDLETAGPAISMLKYLLLKTPTLRSLVPQGAPDQLFQCFVDEYTRWYPHMASLTILGSAR
ncbi:hypothetical protein H4R19_000228 [Coemansia spiralis]|nr:hypothetical protein H4R19_000228 [Coemansia spiralis]